MFPCFPNHHKLHKAQMALDAIITIIPIVLILVFTLNTAAFLNYKSTDYMERQQIFNKLVSIADSVVKQKAVVVETGNLLTESSSYPNWIDESRFNSIDRLLLANQTGLKSLSVTFDKPGQNKYCIYRLVVVGTGKEIHKLYVCGD